jgi:hypothetical protein
VEDEYGVSLSEYAVYGSKDLDDVEWVPEAKPPNLRESPLFGDKRIDGLFCHLDLSWWDKLPLKERMDRYWADPFEAARRRRATLVHWFDEKKRSTLPNQKRDGRAKGWYFPHSVPPLNFAEAGYMTSLEPPLISMMGSEGCYHRSPYPLQDECVAVLKSGNYYVHRTFQSGKDRRWG